MRPFRQTTSVAIGGVILLLVVVGAVQVVRQESPPLVVTSGVPTTVTSTSVAAPPPPRPKPATDEPGRPIPAPLTTVETADLPSAAPARGADGVTTTTNEPSPSAVAVSSPDAGGLYVARVDGSELVRIVTADFMRREAAISPDNHRVAYSMGRVLNLIGIDGKDRVTVAGMPCVSLTDGPTWSPDGTSVGVVTSKSDRTFQLFVVGADGKDPQQVADVSEMTGFSWAPDGRDLVFISADRISRVRPDGTGLERLAEHRLAYNTIAYSPDGAHIAFTAFDGLWVMQRDGANLRRLGPTTDQASGLAWSPDSREIVYGNNSALRIASLEGNDRILVARGSNAQWSSRNRIAFTFYDDAPQGSHIELIDPDGGNRTRLVHDAAGRLGEDPKFSADGSRLVFTSHSGGDGTCNR